MGLVDDLRGARAAYERRDWLAAYQQLSGLDQDGLAADDFVALATTAHLLGRRNDCVQALQRAYRAHVDAGETQRSVRDAFWLALVLMMAGEGAVAGGWRARGERLLDGLGEDTVERGYLRMIRMLEHVAVGEFEQAHEAAVAITDDGRRFDDPDLVAVGLNAQGRGLTMAGQVQEGLRLLDEAMVGVLAGEVSSPIFAGIVYCSMVEACGWVSDFGRMGEWTHALSEWCEVQPGLVAFTGQCAVHRGQLLRLHGSWPEALDELARAAERYAAAGGGPAVGLAHAERADVLRLQGRYDAAQAAFEEAARCGHDGQPGRMLLALAQGRTDAAGSAAQRMLSENTDPVSRSRMLPAAVEALHAGGRLEEMEALSEELAALASSFGSPALYGAAGHATARVALGRGRAEDALAAIRPAVAAWTSVAAPYEVARCRVVTGQALEVLGDSESSRTELEEARSAFARLGAVPDQRAVERLLGEAEAPGGLSPREVEVLRLVAAGQSNPEIAATLVLSEKTVARHLSNIFTKLGVGSRTAAAAFAYEHDLR